MRVLLFRLWILIPKNTPCFRNGIGITQTRFNWLNPLTYLYLFCMCLYALFLYLKHGKNFLNR